MTNYYSAINVPTDVEGYVEVITANTNLYIKPSSTNGSGLGTSENPWKLLSEAFNYLENKRIAKDITVNIIVKKEPDMDAWNQYQSVDSQLKIQHPDSERIIIKGEESTNLDLFGINYYDSTLRAMNDSITGGYLMELTVQTSSNVFVGDFIKIYDENYTSNEYVTGVSGPTFIETDFDNYESGTGETGGIDISGDEYDSAPLSLRKTLAFGCHEVVGVDYNTIASSENILIHVRHTNPTALNHGVTGATAYCTPQSLRFNNNNGNFTDGTTCGYIAGDAYNAGPTGNRLSGMSLPLNSGHTAGATGSFVFTRESTYGGGSGANGIVWDDSGYQTKEGRPIAGIKVKHLPCRIYFDNNDTGLEFSDCRLGKIKDLVICGPGFSAGAIVSLPSDNSVGIKSSDSGGLLEIDNVGVVGFNIGIQSYDNSQVNASGAVVSSCKYGFVSDQNSQMNAKHTIASGCWQGYKTTNHSQMDSSYSIASANSDSGFVVINNSTSNSKYTLSCFNGKYGYEVINSSSLQLSPSRTIVGETGQEHGITNDSLYGGATANARYAYSDKTGSISFRNSYSGVYSENSTVYGSAVRSSYNLHSGFLIDRKSYMDSSHANAFNNGTIGLLADGITAHNSGFVFQNQSTGVIGNCTSSNNYHHAYHAEYGSNVIATNSWGATLESGSSMGFFSDKNSIIYISGISGSANSANGGTAADY